MFRQINLRVCMLLVADIACLAAIGRTIALYLGVIK